MADVFISYAHQDREKAGTIDRALTDRHVSFWSDQKIRAGEEWMPEIERALTESKVIVLCVSASFLASDWGQLEIGVALGRSRDSGVRIIPVILGDSDVPAELKRFQYVDARKLSADEVAAAVEKALEVTR